MNSHQLFQAAIAAREFSHSPYSGFKVGSALSLKNGSTFSGCNIENASYGGTVCAERVAIWKAFSEQRNQKIHELVVITDSEQAWPPCGMCLQVIAEFADSNTLVHLANLDGIQRSFSFSQLLPQSFGNEFLKK